MKIGPGSGGLREERVKTIVNHIEDGIKGARESDSTSDERFQIRRDSEEERIEEMNEGFQKVGIKKDAEKSVAIMKKNLGSGVQNAGDVRMSQVGFKEIVLKTMRNKT